MAIALDAAQDVKKSTGRARSPVPWHQKPLSVGLALSLAAVAAAVFVVFEIWRSFTSSDGTPKRWRAVAEDNSECYSSLVSTQPLSAGACIHDEKTPIPPRPRAWVDPHVAVYSTAVPPHSPPTLRDLGDQGQAEAISFLEMDSGLKGRAWADPKDALSDSDTGAGERDPFRFERVLVANVAKGVDWKPGDRMMWTRVLVQPINFTFAG